MPIATKNNAIIVKDGKLAENCGCCGGWYCCASLSCVPLDVSSVSVSITAGDYLAKYDMRDNLISANSPYKSSAGFLGSLFSGTRQLTKVASTQSPAMSRWETTYSGFPTGCGSQTLSVTLNANSRIYPDVMTILPFPVMYFYSETQFRTLQELTCSGSGSYTVGYGLYELHSWPLCSEFPQSLTYSRVWEVDKALVDQQLAQYGVSANSYGMLAASRGSDEKYGSAITSVVSRTGQQNVSVVITLS